ncbi:MAG: preprotein translocase subunit YajC [Gaiellales bacterium]
MQTYLLLFVAMAAIFYLLILRPQQRAKRAKLEMAQALEVGAEVLTVGGIYGTVAGLRDDDFDLEIADGVVMRMDRRAIASVIRDTDADEAKDADDDASVDADAEDDAPAGDETHAS